MKKYLYAVISPEEVEGYRYYVSRQTPEIVEAADCFFIQEVDLPAPDPQTVIERGLELCDKKETDLKAELEFKLTALKDARAKYLSLEAL